MEGKMESKVKKDPILVVISAILAEETAESLNRLSKIGNKLDKLYSNPNEEGGAEIEECLPNPQNLVMILEAVIGNCIKINKRLSKLDDFLGDYGFNRVETTWDGDTWGDSFYVKNDIKNE